MAEKLLETLMEIRQGDLLEELGEKLGELVGAVRATGKMGEIKLSLKVKPAAKGVLALIDDLKVKLPEVAREATIFYPTEDNGLSRFDPEQMKLPEPKRVEDIPANVRKIGG